MTVLSVRHTWALGDVSRGVMGGLVSASCRMPGTVKATCLFKEVKFELGSLARLRDPSPPR
jgi:hypothetical protein